MLMWKGKSHQATSLDKELQATKYVIKEKELAYPKDSS